MSAVWLPEHTVWMRQSKTSCISLIVESDDDTCVARTTGSCCYPRCVKPRDRLRLFPGTQVTFEDLWTVFLVMELCTGGELFERVTDYVRCGETRESTPISVSAAHVLTSLLSVQERYSEQNVARLFRGILRVVNACHCALRP